MKFYKFVCLLSIFICSSIYALDLKEIEGCYETQLIDHQVPAYGDRYLRTLSTIERDISPSFSTLDNASLEHLIINLYTGSNGMWDSYHPFVLFPEKGIIQNGDDNLTYSLNEDFLLWNNFRQEKVDHSIELKIKRLSDDIIEGEVRYVSRHRNMSGFRHFKLKRILCF